MSIIRCEKHARNFDSDFFEECPECEEECEYCDGKNGEHHKIEVLGDGDNFECDVVGYKLCPNREEED